MPGEVYLLINCLFFPFFSLKQCKFFFEGTVIHKRSKCGGGVIYLLNQGRRFLMFDLWAYVTDHKV